MKKDTVLRKNCVDNKVYSANSMLRFAKFKDNTFHFDPEHKLGGRGGYCLNDEQTINTMFSRKYLNRAFRMNIQQEIYKQLEEEVKIWLAKQKENQI
ncbi:YlxR family protein [Mycoplasma sp. 128]